MKFRLYIRCKLSIKSDTKLNYTIFNVIKLDGLLNCNKMNG